MATRGRWVATLVCVAAVAASCSDADEPRSVRRLPPSTHPLPSSAPPSPPTPARPAPPVPSAGAYLGLWSNPSPRARQARVEHASVEVAVGIRHLYRRWGAPAPVTALRQIAASGALPLLNWGCGLEDEIRAGSHDSWIRTYAAALADFGTPVFLRYAWEMNLPRARQRCGGVAGPAGFVQAWQRVVTIFDEVGATNVAFVWCPGVGPRPRSRTTWDPYFPGIDSVDWIGVDGYVRDPRPRAAADGFRRVFGTFYERFAGLGKPLMIAETGALEWAQPGYLSSLARALPTAYPEVKALVYFDAQGPRGDWSLTPIGNQAFAVLARDPYFSFRSS